MSLNGGVGRDVDIRIMTGTANSLILEKAQGHTSGGDKRASRLCLLLSRSNSLTQYCAKTSEDRCTKAPDPAPLRAIHIMAKAVPVATQVPRPRNLLRGAIATRR
jgi:hypothetical protein